MKDSLSNPISIISLINTAILLVISLLLIVVLSYLENEQSPKPVCEKHENVDDLVKEFDDKELKPGSKEYKEISELTEMDYYHSDK